MGTEKRGLGSDKLSIEEKRAIQRAGGIASGQARRKNKRS